MNAAEWVATVAGADPKRAHLHKVHGITMDGRDWVAASDGWRMLAAPGKAPSDPVSAEWGAMITRYGKLPNSRGASLASLRAWVETGIAPKPKGAPECPECEDTGLVECGDCGGDGDHACDCGHEHDCGNCDGTGEEACQCGREPEDKKKKNHYQSQIAPGVYVNRKLLHSMIVSAPGQSVTLRWGGPTDCVRFDGDGWIGLLMPVSCREEEEVSVSPFMEVTP